jgi:hypothetical protein
MLAAAVSQQQVIDDPHNRAKGVQVDDDDAVVHSFYLRGRMCLAHYWAGG